jgi:hypothetical protein
MCNKLKIFYIKILELSLMSNLHIILCALFTKHVTAYGAHKACYPEPTLGFVPGNKAAKA